VVSFDFIKQIRVWIFISIGLLLHIGWHVVALIFSTGSRIIYELDFLISYTASEIAKHVGYPHLYNVQVQTDIQAMITGVGMQTADLLPFNHPPFLVPLFVLLFQHGYSSAYIVWQVFSILILIGNLVLFMRLLVAGNLPAKQSYMVGLSAVVFYPILVSLLKGQDTIIVLSALVIWALALINKKDRLAGFALAMATIRPQIALGLAIPFIFTRRQVFLWFIFGTALLGVYSYLLIGLDGMLDYVQMIQLSATGEMFFVNQISMFNLLGLLMRSLPDVDIRSMANFGWLIFVGSVVFLSYLWRARCPDQAPYFSIAISILLVSIASPHLHYHDLGILVVPLVLLMMAGYQKGFLKGYQGSAIILSASMILLFADISNLFIKVTIPYLVFLLLTFSWVIIERKKPR
jgi:hypothetical protein